MVLVVKHDSTEALTVIGYDTETGFVTIRMTHPAENDPTVVRLRLAEFYREIGLPFRAARALAPGAEVA